MVELQILMEPSLEEVAKRVLGSKITFEIWSVWAESIVNSQVEVVSVRE